MWFWFEKWLIIILMINYVKHFFTFLLAICLSCLKKISSELLPIFYSIWFFDVELFELFLHFGYLGIGHIIYKYSFPFSRLSSFCRWFPLLCKNLNFIMSYWFIFAFISFTLGDICKKNIATIYVSVPPIFFLGVLWVLILYIGV